MELIKNRIIGIDPGTNILGFAVIDVIKKEYKILDMGVIKLASFPDHTTKLKEIFLQIQEIIETYLPNQMAIEAPFFGKNVQSMLKLGRAQGVSMAAAMTMGLEIMEYSPKKIKQSVTGNGNASKEQVAAMLSQLLKKKFHDQYLDATDALAVAVTHSHQSMGPLGGGKKYKDWSSFVNNNQDRVK
ncbi:crossover junction endodeoxyribonuclease RuvC [Portibacter lacus]|uniref:Crossover junction endodeoxyribonuclease RuvC n=1 Tax=Portibacter lacus TaxID=1099794 RepID=A0AA37SNT6_9BACT|nr:crossover junction endodeoxyribonuclease RuvC [Portibacter lacus]GLR18136.1 crossover junction endodeoxyribonuclease RuvC [Portibacter lacus]